MRGALGALLLALPPAVAAAQARPKVVAVKSAVLAPYASVIALTGDYSPELGALKALAPGAKRVGILHDPRFSDRQPQAAREAAAGLGPLAPSPTAIGQQAGRLTNRIIHEKVNPGALAVAQPEGMEVSINLTAAGNLGSSRDAALELLRFAARRDFPIKVYE